MFESLSADERLGRALHERRLQTASRGRQLAELYEFLLAYPGSRRAAVAEWALAARIGEGTAFRDFRLAEQLLGALQPVHQGMNAGETSPEHVRSIVKGLSPLLGAAPETLDSGPEDARESTAEPASLALIESLATCAVQYARDHTPYQTEREIERWVVAAEPETAEQRHEAALAERDVHHEVTRDGVGILTIKGDPIYTYRVYKGLSAAAKYDKSQAADDDERGIGALRSDLATSVLLEAVTPRKLEGAEDVFVNGFEQEARDHARQQTFGPALLRTVDASDVTPWQAHRSRRVRELLYGEPTPEELDQAGRIEWGPPSRGKLVRKGVAPIQVSLVMDDATFAGTVDNPVIVDGKFVVTAGAARRFVHQAGFQRLIVERNTGELMERSPHVYEPNRELRMFVEARYVVCTFPGCNVPADRCEQDHMKPFNHREPAAGGATTSENLHPPCHPHHDLKTHQGFQVKRSGADIIWITPLGREYITEPFDHRPAHGPSG